MDFEAVKAALQKINYQGPITAEMLPFCRLPNMVLPDLDLARDTAVKMKQIFAAERSRHHDHATSAGASSAWAGSARCMPKPCPRCRASNWPPCARAVRNDWRKWPTDSSVAQRYTDYRQLLADPEIDVVGITTHIHDHRDIAIDALRSGKHVFLEKPMAPTAADCDQILAPRPTAPRLLHGRAHLPVRSARGAWPSRRSTKGRSARSCRCTPGATCRSRSAAWCWTASRP